MENRRAARLSFGIAYRLRCSCCRRSAGNRSLCEHEKAVFDEVHRLEGDKAEENEEEKYIESDDDEIEESKEELLPPECNEYVSSIPRNVIPCKSDRHATDDLFVSIAATITAMRKKTDIEDSSSELFIAYDSFRRCSKCN